MEADSRLRELGNKLHPGEAAVVLGVVDTAVPVVRRLLGIYHALSVVIDDLVPSIDGVPAEEPPTWRHSVEVA